MFNKKKILRVLKRFLWLPLYLTVILKSYSLDFNEEDAPKYIRATNGQKYIRTGKALGTGQYGIVLEYRRNIYGNNEKIAVKFFPKKNINLSRKEDLFLKITSTHRDGKDFVPMYLGFQETNEYSAIIMEKMDGTMEDYLKDDNKTIEEKLGFLVSVNLKYKELMSLIPEHGDLHPGNITYKIDEHNKPQIRFIDFPARGINLGENFDEQITWRILSDIPSFKKAIIEKFNLNENISKYNLLKEIDKKLPEYNNKTLSRTNQKEEERNDPLYIPQSYSNQNLLLKSKEHPSNTWQNNEVSYELNNPFSLKKNVNESFIKSNDITPEEKQRASRKRSHNQFEKLNDNNSDSNKKQGENKHKKSKQTDLKPFLYRLNFL